MRVGLALKDSAIALVVLKGRRLLKALTIEGEEHPAALLKAELQSRRIPGRKARVGLSRNLTVVKTLKLPPVVSGNLAQMVTFELERHVPFPTEDACFDFAAIPGAGGGPIETLVVAAERRTVDRVLRLLEEANLRPVSLTVASHDLIALVGRWSRADRAAWLHRAGEEVSLLLLEGPHLRLSRSLPWTDAETLAEEVRKSLALLRWGDLAQVWVSGDESHALTTEPAFAALAPVAPPPFTPAATRAVAGLGEAENGLTLLALGVALAPRRPVLNLLPEPLRPRQITPGQLTTAASVTAAALLGLSVIFAQGYRDQRDLDRLNQAVRTLDPGVRAVERLNAELTKKRRLLATVTALEEASLKPLPLLKELTEIIPAEAWLTVLNMDPKGVELVGQAAVASQLIPLLENSSWLEKVEFASPVTKARDKEQFRIHASWESAPKPAQPPAQPPAPKAGARRPAR